MSPIPLVVKLEIVLDNEQQRYFPGDAIHGKIFVTANQSHTLRHFRLAWTGRVNVEPIESNKDNYTYFNGCWKLGRTLIKSSTKAQKDRISVPCYTTELVLAITSSEEPQVELQRNQTIALAFTLHVPDDRPLPSCTKFTNMCSDKIVYMLAAFVVNEESKQKFFAKLVVPVFEAVYTKTPDMMTSKVAEQVFRVSLFPQNFICTAGMRMKLPYRSCLPGEDVPVSLTIWNDMEFTRMQTLSISLVRIKQVLANGRIYTFTQQESERVITNHSNKSLDSNKSNLSVQFDHINLHIPHDIIPTITLHQSRLLGISYCIQAKVLDKDRIYTTAEGKQVERMTVDLPFIIGTLSKPNNLSSSSSPTSVPPVAYQRLTKSLPRIPSLSTASSSSTSINRRFTVSSATSSERQRSRQASLQSFRDDGKSYDIRNSISLPSNIHDKIRQLENQDKSTDDNDNTTYVTQSGQVSHTTAKLSQLDPIDVDFNISFDTFTGNSSTNMKDAKSKMNQAVSLEIKADGTPVPETFPADNGGGSNCDSYAKQSRTAYSAKYINRKEALFKIFRNEDDDDDSDEEDTDIVNDEPQQLLDAVTNRMDSVALGQQKTKQSYIFNMFNDDSSSDEDAIIEVPQMTAQGTRPKPLEEETEFHKPNEYIIEYKPDTKDTENHINAQKA